MALPMAGRWAGSTVRSCFIRAGTCPFLLRYFCQKAASVSLEATCARSASACRASSSMIACIHFLSFVQNGNLRFGTEQKRAPPPGRHCQPRDGALLLHSVVPPKFRAGAKSARHSNAVTGHAVPHYRAAGRGRRSRGPLGSELPRRRRSGALAAGGAPLCARRTARTFSVIAFCLFRSAYSSTLCPRLQAPRPLRFMIRPGWTTCAYSPDTYREISRRECASRPAASAWFGGKFCPRGDIRGEEFLTCAAGRNGSPL